MLITPFVMIAVDSEEQAENALTPMQITHR